VNSYNGYLVVYQYPNDSIQLWTKHKKHNNAIAELNVCKNFQKGARCAIVTLYGFVSDPGHPVPSSHSKFGDIIDPKAINWGASKAGTTDHCSECCRSCQPDSLYFRCPITTSKTTGTNNCGAITALTGEI
jgi:hypothetical protein